VGRNPQDVQPYRLTSAPARPHTLHSNVYIYIIMSSIAAALGAIESLGPNEKINIAKIAREYDCDRSTLSRHYRNVQVFAIVYH